MAVELDEDALQELYTWVDRIPLSRPKKSIVRDFSDGVLAAEIVNFFFPKIVELHNYVPASSTQQKLSNWGTLNRKVFCRLNFSIPEDVLRKVTQCSPGAVEIVLHTLKQKIEEKQKQNPSKSSAQDTKHNTVHQGSNEPGTGYAKIAASPNGGHQNPASPRKANNMDPTTRALLEEKQQALLAAQESIQVLKAKVRRLEHLVHLKDVRIDDLTRRLQEAEQKSK
ncbi:sperm flagellar protein 1-like [Erpetoichthys calabaricus]|uniref:sperm flagellar protein 1-like n=1 Tax=Erpetoichthys calabaricus TaxID=27687 RepID=UPI0010A0239E|nr:sperm flagellar protein 1-like [Erpetoichthys calabaricus]